VAAVAPPGAGPVVVVVGGGITGLAAAHRLIERVAPGERPLSVVILEASDRMGGQIRTERHGEFVLEGGPDALVAQKPAAIELCERLGLSSELRGLGGPHAGTQIFHRGRLHAVPDGFLMMAPTRWAPVVRSRLFSVAGKLRMACEPFVSRRNASCDDESLASFVRRRFGREVLERIAEPVIAGLFTADAEHLSLRLTMPRFLDLEAEHGSVIRGLRQAASMSRAQPFGHGTGRGGFVSLDGGLSRIVSALTARLPERCVRTGARVERVAATPSTAGWTVRLAGGEELEASAVVFACPAGQASDALRTSDGVLADELAQIRYASCATVNVAYKKESVGARLEGFGFFVPRTERLPILACSYVSEKFADRAPEGVAVFRAFLGGATRPEALDALDDALIRTTHDTLRGILAISGPPLFAKVYRSDGAMPQFDVGARASIATIRERAGAHPGLFLAGSIGGAFGVPDCIRSGEEAAEQALAFLAGAQRETDAGATRPGSSRWVAYQANQKA
jgi:protoporphyrinogen/coproporphyrinogen III oxidase